MTNLIKSELKQGLVSGLDQARREMIKELDMRTRRFFTSKKERGPIEIKHVSLVSESHSQHPRELSDATRDYMPMMSWAAFHANREIVAEIALLRSIKAACHQGKLAMAGIGELLGSSEIANINPDSVRLEQVTEDRQNNPWLTVEFVYSQSNKIGHLNSHDSRTIVEIDTPKVDWCGYACLLVAALIIIITVSIAFCLKIQIDQDGSRIDRATSMTQLEDASTDSTQDQSYARFLQMNTR